MFHAEYQHWFSPSPQTRLCARLRFTEYHPVSCNAANVTGSIRTVVGSPSAAAMMDPCRTLDSQWEDTLPVGLSWSMKVKVRHRAVLADRSCWSSRYQVLQRSSQFRICGHQVSLQRWDDGRSVNPHLSWSIRVNHFISGRTRSTYFMERSPEVDVISPKIKSKQKSGNLCFSRLLENKRFMDVRKFLKPGLEDEPSCQELKRSLENPRAWNISWITVWRAENQTSHHHDG